MMPVEQKGKKTFHRIGMIEEDAEQEMENDNGTLPEGRKEADPSQETGDQEVLRRENGSEEEHDGLNEAPNVATLRQIIE